jgi:hypothetical protein
MKNIFKLIFAISITSMFLLSCDEEIAFDALVSEPKLDATYYVQFINAAKTMETGVSESGALVDAKSTIAVSLMGMPQTADIKVDLTPDPANTLKPNMYTLSANSITIPAGKTSGSVSFSTVAANMPVGQPVKFVLNMSAGDHNSPSATGTKLAYNVKRIEFCPLVNGVADLAGTWSGDDGAGPETYPSQITTAAEGTKLAVSGMGVGFIEGFWGEAVIEGGTFLMTVTGNGFVDIPRQYIFTTEYEGDPYDYEIKGSGKWENCGAKPVLIITYDIYYPGDEKGLAASYPSYLGGITFLTANIEMSSSKSAQIFSIGNTLAPLTKKVRK